MSCTNFEEKKYKLKLIDELIVSRPIKPILLSLGHHNEILLSNEFQM